MKSQYPPNEGQDIHSKAEAPDEAMELGEGDFASAEDAAQQADEIASLNEKILRLAAELENTRRRADREKIDVQRYAIASFARDLLSVVDTFERALAHAPADKAAASIDSLWTILEGVKLTEANMLSVLERHGVKRISPKGEKFDPNLHQAVAQAPGDQPAGHVLEVAQPGFVIGERVLRAAMVVVSTGPAAPEPPPLVSDAPPGGRFDKRI
jgi:molecular chaperone GrpE